MSVHEIDKLIVHPVGLLSASSYRARGAMPEMIAHQLAPDPAQRFLHRRYLREDVSAVPILINHLLQPTNLSFDAPESCQVARFYLGIDAERLSRADWRFANRAPALRSVGRIGYCTAF
jgi:hypothetical protein